MDFIEPDVTCYDTYDRECGLALNYLEHPDSAYGELVSKEKMLEDIASYERQITHYTQRQCGITAIIDPLERRYLLRQVDTHLAWLHVTRDLMTDSDGMGLESVAIAAAQEAFASAANSPATTATVQTSQEILDNPQTLDHLA